MSVHEMLSALDDREKRWNHGHDMERSHSESWKWFKTWDWENKGKGLGVQAQKSISIGLGTYSAWEDPDRSEFLLIKFFDEEQEIGGYNGQDPPAVWGLAVTVAELNEIEKYEENTIHREPRKDPESENYQLAEWVRRDGDITAVNLTIKIPQYAAPLSWKVNFIRVRGCFKLIDCEETSKKPRVANPRHTVELPKSVSVGDCESCLVYTQELLGGGKVGVVEGDSKLNLKIDEGEGKPSNHGSSSSSNVWVQQVVMSPKLMLNNPTDKPICVTDFYMEYQEGGGKWRKFKNDGKNTRNTTIGLSTSDWNGRRTIRSNPTLGSFTVGEHESIEVYLSGRQYMEGVYPYREYSGKDRLHHNFVLGTGNGGRKVRCRVNFADDGGRKISSEFEVGNPGFTKGFPTYEAAVAGLKKCNDERDGIDDDHRCLLFLSADHPLTFERCYAVVTVPKKNPEYWILTLTTDNREVGRSTTYIYPSELEEIGYKARKQNVAEIEYASQGPVSLHAVIDEASGAVYALRGSIKITHPETEDVLVDWGISTLLDYEPMVQ